MDRPRLAEAIDASDALLESRRAPGQFDVDDEAASPLQVQAFAGRVGGNQDSRGAGSRMRAALPRAPPTSWPPWRVDHGGDSRQHGLEPLQRVAVLGEHDDRLCDPSQRTATRTWALRSTGDALRAACTSRLSQVRSRSRRKAGGAERRVWLLVAFRCRCGARRRRRASQVATAPPGRSDSSAAGVRASAAARRGSRRRRLKSTVIASRAGPASPAAVDHTRRA